MQMRVDVRSVTVASASVLAETGATRSAGSAAIATKRRKRESGVRIDGKPFWGFIITY